MLRVAGRMSYLQRTVAACQLSEARAENPWLAEGSVIVQQQAIRDHAQAMTGFFARTHRRPSWRKAGRDEGFRIVQVRPGDVRRLNRKTAQVRIPKVGWVRFRWSRPVPPDVKSYRVIRDRAGRWYVAFAAVPEPIPAPGTGQAVGIDRGRAGPPPMDWEQVAGLDESGLVTLGAHTVSHPMLSGLAPDQVAPPRKPGVEMVPCWLGGSCSSPWRYCASCFRT